MGQGGLKYRKFGSSEWHSSILGFGASGIAFWENAAKRFDPAAFFEAIRCAVDLGINYLDLGYPYDWVLQEQIAGIVGEALLEGYRGKIKIAVTLPSPLLESKLDFDRYLERQLELLRIESADFCLFGKIDRDSWPVLQRLSARNWAEAAISDGRIDAVGFSFQDHFQVLRQVLEAYDRWSFCQFPFSYMDMDHDPGFAGLKYAASKGVAVVVTQPLKSGRLVKEPPASVGRIWGENRSMSRLKKSGLRFVWSFPEVAVAVRDFRSVQDLTESADLAEDAELRALTVSEELLFNNVRDGFRKLKRIPCSSCRPCMPCPEGIHVPRIFELYNDAFLYEDLQTARRIYRNERHHADRCTRCGDCEMRCAGKLKIVDWLERAHRLLGGVE